MPQRETYGSLDEAGHVAVEIQGLRFEFLGDTQRASSESARNSQKHLQRNVQENVQENVDDWLYEFQWQLKQHPAGIEAAEPSSRARASWLIFADRDGVGEALSALLEAQGERSVLVARGIVQAQNSTEAYEERAFSYSSANDRKTSASFSRRHYSISQLAVELSISGALIVDPLRQRKSPRISLSDAQSYGLRQCPAAGPGTGPSRVARSSAAVAGHARGSSSRAKIPLPLDIAQAPLWGLGRVIAQEHPTLWGGLVDLEPGASPL